MITLLRRNHFTLALSVFVASASWIAQADSGAVGTWNSEMDLQGNLINVTIAITEVDGKLAGKWSSPRGESDLNNVAFEGNKLTFSRTMNRDGQELTLDFSGTVDGDKLDGTLSSAMGDIPLKGTRAAASAPAAGSASAGGIANLAGTWDVTTESQLGTLKRTLIIKESGEGSYNSDTAQWPISNLKVEGDKVSYNVTVNAQGQDLPLTFNGTLSGDSLNGEYTSEAGTGTVVAKRRSAAGGTNALAGTWSITSDSQLGSLQRKLIVKDDGTATYNTDTDSYEVKNFKVDGSNVTFDVTVSLQGQDLPLSFVGAVDGTNLKGVFNSDGNEVAQVVGLKAN